MHKEIVPAAPFPLRLQTAVELEKLAHSSPAQEAAAARVARDLETVIENCFTGEAQPIEEAA